MRRAYISPALDFLLTQVSVTNYGISGLHGMAYYMEMNKMLQKVYPIAVEAL